MHLKVLGKTIYLLTRIFASIGKCLLEIIISIRNNNLCFSYLTSMLKRHKAHLSWKGLKFNFIFYMNIYYVLIIC